MEKQSVEYARILNVSDAAYNISTNYWAVIETEAYSGHSKTFKMERFAKRKKMSELKCATRNFQGKGMFVEQATLGHYDKEFAKNTRKRGPAAVFFS